MMKNTCGIEAFMSAFQASIICLRYPGLTAWAMRYWPFRPLTGNFDFAETGNFNFARPAILTLQKPEISTLL